MTAPFVQERFEAEVTTWIEKMTAAILMRRVIAYNGRIGDVDVIVAGWPNDPANPTKTVKPLALVMTPALFELLDVDATKTGGDASAGGVHGQAEAGDELLQWHLDECRAEIQRLRTRLRDHARKTARAEAERNAARRRLEHTEALASVDDILLTDLADNGCTVVKIVAEHEPDGWEFVWRWESVVDGEPHADYGDADSWTDCLSAVLNGTAGAMGND